MKVIDWREIALDGGLLREPESDESRLIVWVPAESEGDYRYWERIGNVARGEVVVEDGLASTPATSIRARRRVRGLFGKLRDRFGEGRARRSFVIPGGESVEQCGERSVDCLLVWPDDPAEEFEEARVESRWPEARRRRRLGPRLFLVEGVSARGGSDERPGRRGPEHALAGRRTPPAGRAGAGRDPAPRRPSGRGHRDDRPGHHPPERGRSPARRSASLEQALSLVRQLGDAVRESDINSNLGMALLHVQQAPRARQLFEQEMNLAARPATSWPRSWRSSGSGWPRRSWATRRGAQLVRTRAGAGASGRRPAQEANLLWLQAIQLAELDRGMTPSPAARRRSRCSASGPPAGRLVRGLFAEIPDGPVRHLAVAGPAGVAGGPGNLPRRLAGRRRDGQQPPNQAQANPKGTTGPGLLRMAMSATKAMAKFAGLGIQDQPARPPAPSARDLRQPASTTPACAARSAAASPTPRAGSCTRSARSASGRR